MSSIEEHDLTGQEVIFVKDMPICSNEEPQDDPLAFKEYASSRFSASIPEGSLLYLMMEMKENASSNKGSRYPKKRPCSQLSAVDQKTCNNTSRVKFTGSVRHKKPSSGKLRSAPTPSICNENFDDPTSAKECPGVTSPSHPSPEPLLEDSEVKIETMPNQEASADIRAISLSPSSPSNQDAASTRHGVKRKKAPSGEYKTALVSRLEQVLAIANKKPSRGEVLEMAVGSCYRDLLESGLQDLASSFYAASLKLVANYEEKSLAAAKKLLR